VAETGSCPNCGAELPPELGQHALTPVSGLVQCPTCGENVRLGDADDETDVPRSKKSVGGESGAPESFSGEETIECVMEELEDKPGGPKGDE
jgi:endogenous inhibitor of DNA gyrase (YacG/DUF329 family)